ASQDEGDVLSAKPEAVGERHVDRSLTGHMGDVIEIALRIRVVEIDGRGEHAVADGQQADDRLDAAGGRDQVPHHALGAGDPDLVGVVPEGPLDGERLDRVVDGGAGPVRVDVVDVRGIEPRVGQSLFHAGDRATALV